jgi:signal transduction histidine kinase
MLFHRVDPRLGRLIRLLGLVLITWSVIANHPAPGTDGRSLVILGLLVVCFVAAVAWAVRPLEVQRRDRQLTPDLWAMAIAGAVLIAAAPNSAASAYVFAALITAGMRQPAGRALPLLGLAVLGLAAADLVYDNGALGLLAYALGFVTALLAATNSRQSIERADEAELLLAQTQRSHEEQLRAARLEESTRIAREIHDVLAHALAGLTIQLEATRSLVERGAGREVVLERVDRAYELAREGLRETRRAVGALRGDPVPVADAVRALVDDYRASQEGAITLTVEGDGARLAGEVGLAVLRTVQEALTNVRKHAPGATVAVAVHAGAAAGDDVLVTVSDRPDPSAPARAALHASGGGYGLGGMRERAQALGGTLSAGASGDGWQVALRLPAAQVTV